MNKSEIKNLVDRLSDLIDKCENDFEAMVFNPDATFDLLLDCHSALSRVLRGEVT
ncbi:nuclear transport factor 2 family protein [Streptococcus dysgalactiae]|uniref:nuclear transport factor 2 family protein n=1 Tax=Streptococcus dysgalactiae TaxID=1334 RepID=UPI001CF26A5B|nr:nuclear transport factor 2 family protein [Streptococcus dysgalactiae]MCB2849247.1 nuclear transport factor 2 family protein [Streptococcus dysgalactiae subsp. dysgalactiae]